MKKQILVSGPSITEKEISYVARAAKTAWDEGAYKFVSEFEKRFAKYVHVKYALATSSCTGALHLALAVLGIKKGDEVIVPDITWIASVAPLTYVGAKPVFVDIEADTWCIDPEKIEAKITKRTRAIMPVHLYGHPAEMREILRIAKKHKLFVIEDAAESLGAKYHGKMIGSMGDAGVFSFHGSKTLVTGEGGMLVTNDKKIYKRAEFLNRHAQSKMFWSSEIGYKYKMSDLQAALGLAQLSRISGLLQKKRQIFSWYKKYLSAIPELTINTERKGTRNSYWMVTAVWDKKLGIKKEEMMKRLLRYGIHSRPFFYPLTSLPPFKERNQNSVAASLSPCGINLPCGQNIREPEVKYVCGAFKNILDNA